MKPYQHHDPIAD